MAGACPISASLVSASTMNSAKSTRRVRLLARIGSPTWCDHTRRPWLSLPFDGPDELQGIADPMLAASMAASLPNLMSMIRDHALQPGYDHGEEFAWGLDLILDGLERRLTSSGSSPIASSRPLSDGS